VVQVSRGATCSALPCIKTHNGFADHLLSSVGAAVVLTLHSMYEACIIGQQFSWL